LPTRRSWTPWARSIRTRTQSAFAARSPFAPPGLRSWSQTHSQWRLCLARATRRRGGPATDFWRGASPSPKVQSPD